ncbi:MAG: FUSC family membrane protein [Bacteroidota bacterium]
MEIRGQQIKYFLFSQYLADGIRITLEIVLPVIICSYLGYADIGYTIAQGALCVSISDAPGPVEHKRNGMLYSVLFVVSMSVLTGFANNNILLIGLLILCSSFFFTMFSIYGNRAASVGTGALLIMILRLSVELPPIDVLKESVLILAGGLWYFVMAMLFFRVTPYRPEQRALGNCIHEMAKFLRVKALFYDHKTDFKEEYRQLVAQQIVVSEAQDALRELLYKNRELMQETTKRGKMLILTFADVMELYEQITAIWYDYESLHEKFGDTGILEDLAAAIREIAEEMDVIGLAIQSNIAAQKKHFVEEALEKIKSKIDALGKADPGNLVLKKILVNMINISRRVDDLYSYFMAAKINTRQLQSQNYYASFVSHQQIDFSLFRNNLNLESSVFRHSLRMMITCMAGFFIAKIIDYGHHSYWILLTIIIILKPGFGLTKERNIQRLLGTVVGAIIGLTILGFIQDRDVLFGFIIFFMIGTYTYQRLNYIVMVIFTTPYILILFNLLGLPFWTIAQERLIDTVIGCILAFLASYLLFPHWESSRLQSHMETLLKANIDYLRKLKEMMCGKEVPLLDYKLVRKELFISIANLSAAFHRMLNDPRGKQQNRKATDQFVVLNHILSSNVAGLASGIRDKEKKIYPREILQKIKRAITIMEEALQTLDEDFKPGIIESIPGTAAEEIQPGQLQLANQVDFINKVAGDIKKTTRDMAAGFKK